MRLIALKPIRVKTSKGPVEIQTGDTFNPVDSRPFIEAGIAEPITQETFKKTFEKLSEHLRQRDYTPENMAKLKELSSRMDDAWQSMNFPVFREAITAMMDIPGNLRPEGNKPVAAKIYSHTLQDTVWLGLDPSFVGDGDGIPVYTIQELRMMKGASSEEIKAVHRVKREIGGVLITVQGREGTGESTRN